MNYIKTSKSKIIISSFQKQKIYKITINNYLDKKLSIYLTTLEGRMQAIKNKYHICKLIPIYIDNNLCLQPIFKITSERNIFVNIYNINKIIDYGNYSIVLFYDSEELILKMKSKTLKNKIKKALQISL